jgi:hypothetical protein
MKNIRQFVVLTNTIQKPVTFVYCNTTICSKDFDLSHSFKSFQMRTNKYISV